MVDPAELPLRDIHLPPPIGWWPPAPGWWIVAALGAGAVAGWLWFRWWRRRPVTLARAAASELARVRAAFATHGDRQRLLRDLSVLLRRICISRFSRARAAALHGDAWLGFLDRADGTDRFTAGPGRVLADGPYRQTAEVDPDALLAACDHLVRALAARPAPP
jgi:hypothetical protein